MTDISLILGVTALVTPIAVKSKIVKNELPLLVAIVLFCGFLLYDGNLNATDAYLLLAGLVVFIVWSVYSGIKSPGDALEAEFEEELKSHAMSVGRAIFWLVAGLTLLIVSSRILVWGAVEIASALGVSELIIGLTIVALGTSLPELAASIIAVRKGEHDIAIGNVVGSNMFNILGVIGIAGAIEPISKISAEVFYRDWSVMLALTLMLLVMAFGFGRQGRINRFEGGVLLCAYITYNAYLTMDVLA